MLLTLKDTRNQFAHGKLRMEISEEILEECRKLTNEILDKLIEDIP